MLGRYTSRSAAPTDATLSSDRAPGKTTPYHCDGILVPKAWSGWIQCEILTAKPYMVSDHNPVLAVIDPRAQLSIRR